MDEQDHEATSFSIHITGQEPSSSNKKSLKRSSSQSDVQFSNAVNKKLRIEAPVQHELPASTLPSTGHTSSNASNTTSFRHLFSFGAEPGSVVLNPEPVLNSETQATDGQLKKPKKKKKKSKPFTFFSAATKPQPSDDLVLPQVVLEPTSEAHGSADDMDTRPDGDANGDANANRHASTSVDVNADSSADVDTDDVRDAASESSSEDGADRFNANDDDAIMQIALSFCRRTTLHDVDDDWNAAGGVFEQMKHDFRLKRNAVLRGRKLGTS